MVNNYFPPGVKKPTLPPHLIKKAEEAARKSTTQREPAKAGGTVTAVEGDTLWKMAVEAYGKENADLWRAIKAANEERVVMRGDKIAIIQIDDKFKIPTLEEAKKLVGTTGWKPPAGPQTRPAEGGRPGGAEAKPPQVSQRPTQAPQAQPTQAQPSPGAEPAPPKVSPQLKAAIDKAEEKLRRVFETAEALDEPKKAQLQAAIRGDPNAPDEMKQLVKEHKSATRDLEMALRAAVPQEQLEFARQADRYPYAAIVPRLHNLVKERDQAKKTGDAESAQGLERQVKALIAAMTEAEQEEALAVYQEEYGNTLPAHLADGVSAPPGGKGAQNPAAPVPSREPGDATAPRPAQPPNPARPGEPAPAAPGAQAGSQPEASDASRPPPPSPARRPDQPKQAQQGAAPTAGGTTSSTPAPEGAAPTDPRGPKPAQNPNGENRASGARPGKPTTPSQSAASKPRTRMVQDYRDGISRTEEEIRRARRNGRVSQLELETILSAAQQDIALAYNPRAVAAAAARRIRGLGWTTSVSGASGRAIYDLLAFAEIEHRYRDIYATRKIDDPKTIIPLERDFDAAAWQVYSEPGSRVIPSPQDIAHLSRGILENGRALNLDRRELERVHAELDRIEEKNRGNPAQMISEMLAVNDRLGSDGDELGPVDGATDEETEDIEDADRNEPKTRDANTRGAANTRESPKTNAPSGGRPNAPAPKGAANNPAGTNGPEDFG